MQSVVAATMRLISQTRHVSQDEHDRTAQAAEKARERNVQLQLAEAQKRTCKNGIERERMIFIGLICLIF